MKPEYEKIVEKPDRSFTIKLVNRKSRPNLNQAWHFHPEIEICYTLKSNGRRFVGNQISDYHAGDLVLLGSNLPHGFTTDENTYQVVIQMHQDFLGEMFMDRPELREVKALFNESKRGLQFSDLTRKKAHKLINRLVKTEGLQQLVILLELLQALAESEEATPICSEEYAFDFDEKQLGRIKVVYDHIMENFTNQVSIKEVANKLNISEAAFYKFIKKETKKTYTEIINEFRINHATKLLISSDRSISQVCFQSGFNNVSYFNRKFKELIGKTPKELREDFE